MYLYKFMFYFSSQEKCHIFCFSSSTYVNPRTYKQTHTPTVVQGGRGVNGPPPPWVFVMLQYFETFSPLVESL